MPGVAGEDERPQRPRHPVELVQRDERRRRRDEREQPPAAQPDERRARPAGRRRATRIARPEVAHRAAEPAARGSRTRRAPARSSLRRRSPARGGRRRRAPSRRAARGGSSRSAARRTCGSAGRARAARARRARRRTRPRPRPPAALPPRSAAARRPPAPRGRRSRTRPRGRGGRSSPVSSSSATISPAAPSGARSRRPMKRTCTPWAARSGSSRSIVSSKISISASTSSRRPRPVLGRERVDGQRLDAEVDGRLDGPAERARAGAVALGDRQAAGRRPAAVAVHDDRDRARNVRTSGERPARRQERAVHSASAFGGRSSDLHDLGLFVLAAARRSASCARRSASARCSSARCSSSAPTSPLSTSSLRWWIASRRTLRTATRPSSAMWRTTLTSSLRRSSVSCGIGRRMILPSFDGVRPRSDSWIAFSIVLDRARVERLDRQHARLRDVDRRELPERRPLAVVVDRGSGRAAPRTRGPVRTVLNSCCACSTALSMRRVGIRDQVVDHRPLGSPGVEMIVPRRSPATTRRMLPSASSNT